MPRPLIIITNADRVFLAMMREILDDEGYEALTARESSNVFALIKTQQPALVIIELLLTDPEAGLTIINKMRLDRTTTTIPIIIASTTTQLIKANTDHLHAKRCAILVNPFDLEELLTMIATYAPLSYGRCVMDEQQYADVVARLHRCRYIVTDDSLGWIVQHQVDSTDQSSMRTRADVVNFADLMEWAMERRDDAPDLPR